MSDNVRLDSVEALAAFRVWLCKAVEAMQVGLDEAESEIQRTAIWLQNEQVTYWKGELRKRTEQVARAKLELQRKQQQKSPLGGRYSHVDEKKALALAKRRHEEAEQKMTAIKRWSRELEQEMFDYQGAVRGLSQAVHGGMPESIAQLDRMIAAIESYMSVKPLSEQPSTAPGLDEVVSAGDQASMSMARPSSTAPQGADEQYVRLCRRLPDQKTRDAVATAVESREWRDPHRLEASSREAVSSIEVERVGVAADAKIVIAAGAREHGSVFLARSLPHAGDTGWYVGFADEREAGDYEGWRAADVLSARPDWRDLLTLPAGYVVVIDGTNVRSIYNANAERVWPDQTGGEQRP